MTDNRRVLYMNAANAHDWDGVPFPARQQLGDPDALAHKFPLAGPQDLGAPESGGHGVRLEPSVVHPVEPVLSPSGVEDDQPDQFGAAALQRGEPGRNWRTIGASQSSSRPLTTVAERPTSAGPATSTSEDAGVPNGTVPDVLAWVGDDSDRARAALDAENRRTHPRQSLIEQLNGKI